MRESTFEWETDEGLRIHAVEWKPEAEAKAAVAYIHGMGDYGGRFRDMAEAYARGGLATLAVDLPGHGRSGGKRGHSSFARIRKVIDRLLEEARARFPGKPVFLCGLSMGGLLVIDYLLERRPALAGAVLMNPGLAAREPVAAWRRGVARFMADCWPSLTVTNGLPTDGCSDPAVLKAWKEDPLAHAWISARLGFDLLAAQPRVLARAGEIATPLLVELGDADTVVDPSAAERFAAAAKDATIERFKGLNHDLPHELGKEAVFRVAVDWISRRL